MSAPRTRVAGPVVLPDGSPAVDHAEIVFKLKSWDRVSTSSGKAVAMSGTEIAKIEDGAISIDLLRNSAGDRGSLYEVSYRYWSGADGGMVSQGMGLISVAGAGPLNFADLLALPAPVPNVPDALAQAIGAATSAGVDAGRAEAAADRIDLGALDDAVVSTSEDRIATAADRVATGSDRTATEAAQTAAAGSAVSAGSHAISANADRIAAQAAADASIQAGQWDQEVADAAARLALTGLAANWQVYQLDTEHVWRWDGSAWVDRGPSPLALKASKYVEPIVNDISAPGVNLLNVDDPDWLNGYRMNPATGAPVVVASAATTGFIPVASGKKYYTNLYGFGAFYDQNKVFVSRADQAGVWDRPILTSPGDGYIRMSTDVTTDYSPEKMFFVEGVGPPATLTPFGSVLDVTRIINMPGGGLADGSVAPVKTAFWKRGKNLANPIGRVDGYYMNAFGVSDVNAAYCHWPAFKVSPGQVYTGNQSMRTVVFFDVGGRAMDTVSITTAVTQFTVPDLAVRAIVNTTLSSAASFQVELGSVSTAFQPFRWEARDSLPSGEPLIWGSEPGPDLVAKIDATLGTTGWREEGGGARPFHFGFENLRETRQRLRKLRYGEAEASDRLSVIAIGDSWTHDTGRWCSKFARSLWRKYHPSDANMNSGPVGQGLISFGGVGGYANGSVNWNNYVVVESGTWDTAAYGTGGGPDTCQAVGADGAILRFQGGLNLAAGFKHTLLFEGGAGKIAFSWDGGVTWDTDIDLAAYPSGLQSLEIVKSGTATNPCQIKAVSGSPCLYGVFQEKPGVAGVLVNKLGATGTKATQWASVNATRWKAGVAKLDPKLAIIMHGTNDQSGTGRTKAQFKADINTIVTRILEVNPACDILLAAPCENQRAGNVIAMSEYADAMYEIAISRQCAFVDMQPHFGIVPADYAAGSSRPWFHTDGIHPLPASGGFALTDAFLRAIGEQPA